MRIKQRRNSNFIDFNLQLFDDGGIIELNREHDKVEIGEDFVDVTMRFTLHKNMNAVRVNKDTSEKYGCDKIIFRTTPANPENKICVDASGQYIFVFGGYGGNCNLGIPCKMLYDVQRDTLITKETSIAGSRYKGYYLANPDEEMKFMAALEAYGIQWSAFSGEFKHVGWFPKDGEDYWYIDRDDKDPFKFKVKKSSYKATHIEKPEAPEFRWNRFKSPDDAEETASRLLKGLQAQITEMIGGQKWT